MISVITVSNRPGNLLRCAAQVRRQRVDTDVEHVIVVDGLELDPCLPEELQREGSCVSLVSAPSEPRRFVFEKLGALRNLGVRQSTGSLLAFLDDDNEWEDNHLASLEAVLRHNPDADFAYSWRTLLNRDGTPHLVRGLYPWGWGADLSRRKALFQIQHAAGILSEGSSLAKDQYGFVYEGRPYSCVDTSELLVRRSLFSRVRYREDYSYTEILYGFCDDYLFGIALLEAGAQGVCTELPTLRYYLGGSSQEGGNG